MTLLTDQGAIGASTGTKLVAYDAATLEVSAFKNGTIAALIVQNSKQEGKIAMDVVAKLIAGQHMDPVVFSYIVVIHSGETAKIDSFEYKTDCRL